MMKPSSQSQVVALNDSIHAQSAKKEWISWFRGLLGGGAILALLYLIIPPKYALADYMTLAIAALGCTAIYKCYGDVCFLDRETKLASEQVRQLTELNDIGGFLDVAQPSVFRSHIASLHTIFLSDSNISQDGLIEITHSRLLARNRVVELLASILITLGLIGTIIGMLISTGGLGELFEPGKGDDVIAAGMKKAMAGLGTAFVTTLFGAMLGGVLLRILTSVVDANIFRYVAHLAELTEVYVLPAMRRTANRLEAEGWYRQQDAHIR